MLTDEQQNQLKDILRLIPPDEQAAFLDMLAHDLRGRDLDRGELRRVAEHTWRKFLQHGWPMHSPEMWPNGSKLALGGVAHRVDYGDKTHRFAATTFSQRVYTKPLSG